MKILVTYCAGFIGFHLSKKLLQRGDDVIGIDSLNEYYDINLKLNRLKELGVIDTKKDIALVIKIFNLKPSTYLLRRI